MMADEVEVIEEYRVVLWIMQDDEWEEDKIYLDRTFSTYEEAKARAVQEDVSKFSDGTFTYVEHRTITKTRWEGLL